MVVAVDTNILLDVLIPDAPEQEASRHRLEAASAQGPMVVCETVYAELAAHFALPGAIDRFLGDIGARLHSSNTDTLEAAARAHREYLARRSAAAMPILQRQPAGPSADPR